MATKADKEIEKLMQGIGKRMKELRKKKYSNGERFAYENDINRVQYGRYENGNDLRMSSFLKILKALKITPKEFFGEGFE
jgi:transcriptional regulator with XRE-family HTH domain